ncbi:MAG: hypothetical protein HKN58_05305 [Xanthomonadales bacterium]|nr:hypothetical protein [Xanthomonadales bacterium]
MINQQTIMALSLFFCAATAFAETTKLSEIEAFEQERATILEDIDSGVIYSEISHKDANTVRDALKRISTALATVDNPRELDQEKLVVLYNDQNLVNTILTMAENDSRQVCRRRGRLGTNFKTTTCETVAERRQRQEADRLAIDKILKSDIRPVIGPGSLGGNQ